MIRKAVIKNELMKNEEVKIVYNLFFKNALYSLECYKEGRDKTKLINYSFAENITDDEGEAEVFLKLITKGSLLPVHIKEVAHDYFKAYC